MLTIEDTVGAQHQTGVEASVGSASPWSAGAEGPYSRTSGWITTFSIPTHRAVP